MLEAQPTPTPWRYQDRNAPEGGQLILNGHGPVGQVYSLKDAALIVKAVNNHQKLVEVLERLRDAGETWTADIYEIKRIARKALADLKY